MIFSNITSRRLVIADSQTGQLIADFRPLDIVGEAWQPTKDDLANVERTLLTDVGARPEYRSVALVTRLQETANEFRSFNLSTERMTEQVKDILSRYLNHYVKVINKDNCTQLLIEGIDSAAGRIRKFSVEFRYDTIFKGMQILDYHRKLVLTEIPSLNIGWAEPPEDYALWANLYGIVGLLTSRNSWVGPGSPGLGSITEYELSENQFFNQETYVRCLLFPTVNDAEAAGKLLAPLVGLNRVGLHWDRNEKILKILLLDEESMACVTKGMSTMK